MYENEKDYESGCGFPLHIHPSLIRLSEDSARGAEYPVGATKTNKLLTEVASQSQTSLSLLFAYSPGDFRLLN